MLRQGLGTETQTPEVSSGERTRVSCEGTVCGAKEQCTTGGGVGCYGRGVECHGRGNPGGGLGPQEKQGAIAGEGERRRGRLP